MTHVADITNPDTQAGKLYEFLFDNLGKSFTTWRLSQEAHSLAPSTVISQVRAQLPPGLKIDVDTKRKRGKTLYYYTLLEA
jgi:hypothetical protein